MLKTISLSVAAALLVALNPSPAQQDTGVITGEILDASGAPIANAVVEVKNTGYRYCLAGQTSAEGSYTTPPLRIGTYSVTVEAHGLQTRHPGSPDVERSGPVALSHSHSRSATCNSPSK